MCFHDLETVSALDEASVGPSSPCTCKHERALRRRSFPLVLDQRHLAGASPRRHSSISFSSNSRRLFSNTSKMCRLASRRSSSAVWSACFAVSEGAHCTRRFTTLWDGCGELYPQNETAGFPLSIRRRLFASVWSSSSSMNVAWQSLSIAEATCDVRRVANAAANLGRNQDSSPFERKTNRVRTRIGPVRTRNRRERMGEDARREGRRFSRGGT